MLGGAHKDAAKENVLVRTTSGRIWADAALLKLGSPQASNIVRHFRSQSTSRNGPFGVDPEARTKTWTSCQRCPISPISLASPRAERMFCRSRKPSSWRQTYRMFEDLIGGDGHDIFDVKIASIQYRYGIRYWDVVLPSPTTYGL